MLWPGGTVSWETYRCRNALPWLPTWRNKMFTCPIPSKRFVINYWISRRVLTSCLCLWVYLLCNQTATRPTAGISYVKGSGKAFTDKFELFSDFLETCIHCLYKQTLNTSCFWFAIQEVLRGILHYILDGHINPENKVRNIRASKHPCRFYYLGHVNILFRHIGSHSNAFPDRCYFYMII